MADPGISDVELRQEAAPYREQPVNWGKLAFDAIMAVRNPRGAAAKWGFKAALESGKLLEEVDRITQDHPFNSKDGSGKLDEAYKKAREAKNDLDGGEDAQRAYKDALKELGTELGEPRTRSPRQARSPTSGRTPKSGDNPTAQPTQAGSPRHGAKEQTPHPGRSSQRTRANPSP